MPRIPGFGFLAGVVSRARSLLRGLRSRSAVEAEMSEEFRLHIAMRTEDLMRDGLSRREATRQAHLEFGHVEKHKDAARASRGLRWFDQIGFSWLDVKLGLRMLVAHPGLTLVTGFALAVGIPVGMAPMHVSNALEAPLPEDPQNRVRAIRLWDPATTSIALPTYFELDALRSQLTTFQALGAFRNASYNVASDDGRAAPVPGAEVTASTFDILGTPPLMGRTLDRADEVPGAANVVVLGYDLWQARFASDPDIVGKTVRVGQVPHVAVGVMPEDFLFPFNQQVWVPLREEQSPMPGQGRTLLMYGRLAYGISSQEAAAELSGVRLPASAELTEARTRLQYQVVPFALSFMGIPPGGLKAMPEFYLFQIMAFLILLVACGNVAMLVLARTATRFREMAVRTALGASRARIVSQIFVETLVLAVVAAGVGLVSINWLIGRIPFEALAGTTMMPYWLSLQVTREAVLWALGWAVLSATVAGVAPALRITGKKVQQNIQRTEAGRSGVKFGGVTSALIMADVAISVVVVGMAVGFSDQLMDTTHVDELTGIPALEYLAVEVRLPSNLVMGSGEADLDLFRERLASTQRAMVERLEADPRVRSVAVADALPRMDHRSRRVEVEGVETSGGSPGRYTRTAQVDVDFFEALNQPILAGRGFEPGDLGGDVQPVIVNTVFVDNVLGGLNPIGRRLRFVTSGTDLESPWHEIIGVVGHLGVYIVNPEGDEGVYLPVSPGGIYPLQLGLHVGASPESFTPRLREIAAEVNPDAILGTPTQLSNVYQGDWYLMVAVTGGLGLLVVILIALAASGIYAIMSFSVSERTREIGIRTALGAQRRSLVITVLRRSLTQIGVGALVGMPMAAWILIKFQQQAGSGSAGVALGISLALGVTVVTVVALFSCVAPTRRLLNIEATAALRAEG